MIITDPKYRGKRYVTNKSEILKELGNEKDKDGKLYPKENQMNHCRIDIGSKKEAAKINA